jgi:hypothetical protein
MSKNLVQLEFSGAACVVKLFTIVINYYRSKLECRSLTVTANRFEYSLAQHHLNMMGAPSPAHKYQARVEVNDNDNHLSSLLPFTINYDRKKVL